MVTAARQYTGLAYRGLARRAAATISDHVAAGFEVVVGVGASPSCGVTTTLDLDGAVEAMASCRRCDLCPAAVDERGVAANVTGGAGIFISALRRRLALPGSATPPLLRRRRRRQLVQWP